MSRTFARTALQYVTTTLIAIISKFRESFVAKLLNWSSQRMGPNARSERVISVEILEQNESAATIAIELRDAETGTPIELQNRFEDHRRFAPIGTQVRDGYISVGETRVETNSSGIATVTLTQPGAYSVAYHPERGGHTTLRTLVMLSEFRGIP